MTARRHLLQAALAMPLLRWRAALAQSPERNLLPVERKLAPGAPDTASLLRAPRRALLIGNGAYRTAPLRNPGNDARSLAAALQRLGFVVEAAFDAPRQAMLDAI